MSKSLLDARFLLCPLPVIRVQDKVKGWMVATQMERMRANLGKIQPETLKKLFKYLEKVEKDIDTTIEDEESLSLSSDG